ncbi:MAG TPA: hypothetical protein VIJ10_18690 [Vicinamibacteria bacterium]|jgi:hypothetical protein
MSAPRLAALALGFAAVAPSIVAEPIFLSRQYARCANCHYSPTGGGLLTPYGRSLSREELSTFGKSSGTPQGREHEFLYGVAGGALGPLSLGVDLRPSHLDIDLGRGISANRDILMNAEVVAALRRGGFTFYAELGRQPRGDDPRVASFEHWIGFESERGFGARAGRFLPAYGVRFADHTTFTRAPMGFDNEDQVYALELSHRNDKHLLQLSLGPGRADDVDDSELRAFTASARFQYDLTSRAVLVASGLYRDASELAPSNGSAGLAVGVAPFRRFTLWTQGDVRFQGGDEGQTAYALVADAAIEVYRGVWLKLSPQLLTAFGDSSGGVMRYSAGVNWLARTHWDVVVSYYYDDDRTSDRSTKTLLLQLHLYL